MYGFFLIRGVDGEVPTVCSTKTEKRLLFYLITHSLLDFNYLHRILKA